MALEHNDGGKLALKRLKSAFPVRAKTRRHTITPEGTPGLLYRSDLGRCQTTLFLQGVFLKKKSPNGKAINSLKKAYTEANGPV
jgi:hypothetical protein